MFCDVFFMLHGVIDTLYVYMFVEIPVFSLTCFGWLSLFEMSRFDIPAFLDMALFSLLIHCIWTCTNT